MEPNNKRNSLSDKIKSFLFSQGMSPNIIPRK